MLYGSLHLFPILPHNVMLYAVLRSAHTILAYLLFLTILAHFGAVLFHTWVLRDGIFSRMAPWRVRAQLAARGRFRIRPYSEVDHLKQQNCPAG